ncbi:MAG: lysophospholipase [Candidatus Njordarchaeales archaeon]
MSTSGNVGIMESKIQVSDGTKLFYRAWKSEEEKDIIIGVHGYAEHSGRYHHVGEFLARNGYSLYMMDLRGHGRSGGIPGYIKNFWQFVDDLDFFVDFIRESTSIDKVFMLGHSMGGLISILYALDRGDKLKSLIVSGPALGTSVKISVAQRILLPIISRVQPKYRVPITINPNELTHDSAIANEYSRDPLVFKKGTIRLLMEMLKAMSFAQQNAQKLRVPILILHGGDDKIVPPESSEIFFNNLKIERKERIVYPGFYHEILNEIGKEKVLEEILDWLNSFKTRK